MFVAVWPVTSTLPSKRVSRMVLTRFSVASEDGPLDGVTEISARSLPSMTWAGETAATSGSVARCLAAASGSPPSTTIVSWPLAPTPKPSETRS